MIEAVRGVCIILGCSHLKSTPVGWLALNHGGHHLLLALVVLSNDNKHISDPQATMIDA